MGYGMLPDFRVFKHRHLEFVARIARDVSCNGARVFLKIPPHEGHVFAACGLMEELVAEKRLGIWGLGHHKQPGRVLVYAVYESEPRVGNVIVWIVFEMPCEGVDKCAVVISVSRMHDKSCGLVDHEQVFVFIDYVERYVLGYDFVFIARTVHHDAYDIRWLDLVGRFYRRTVDEDASCVGSLLYPVAGCALHPFDEELVNPQQLLSFVGFEAEVLEKFASVVGQDCSFFGQLYVRFPFSHHPFYSRYSFSSSEFSSGSM